MCLLLRITDEVSRSYFSVRILCLLSSQFLNLKQFHEAWILGSQIYSREISNLAERTWVLIKQNGIPAALRSCSAGLTLVCYGHNVVLFLFTCLLLLVCFEYNSLKKNSTTFLSMWFLIFLIEYSSYNIKFTFNVYTLVVLNNSPSCVIITTV